MRRAIAGACTGRGAAKQRSMPARLFDRPQWPCAFAWSPLGEPPGRGVGWRRKIHLRQRRGRQRPRPAKKAHSPRIASPAPDRGSPESIRADAGLDNRHQAEATPLGDHGVLADRSDQVGAPPRRSFQRGSGPPAARCARAFRPPGSRPCPPRPYVLVTFTVEGSRTPGGPRPLRARRTIRGEEARRAHSGGMSNHDKGWLRLSRETFGHKVSIDLSCSR